MPFLIGKKMIIMRRAYARQKMGQGAKPLAGSGIFAYGKNGLRPPCAAGCQRAELRGAAQDRQRQEIRQRKNSSIPQAERHFPKVLEIRKLDEDKKRQTSGVMCGINQENCLWQKRASPALRSRVPEGRAPRPERFFRGEKMFDFVCFSWIVLCFLLSFIGGMPLGKNRRRASDLPPAAYRR